jgi:hypothetical protein
MWSTVRKPAGASKFNEWLTEGISRFSSQSGWRFVDAVLFEFGVKRLGKAGFRKSHNLRPLQSEVFFQVLGLIMLHDGVVSEFGEDFRPAVFRDVGGDQDKVQFAFAALQSVASDQQDARTQDEGEETFDGFGRRDFFHRGRIDCKSKPKRN